jgi:hypothetical protein
MIEPCVGTILRFNDKVFKVVEVTTTRATRWVPADQRFGRVDVPAVAVLESHPSWAGWHRRTYAMHLSYWKSMCTRGATELPADWQPPAESAEVLKMRKRWELLAEIKPLLADDQYLRLLELL